MKTQIQKKVFSHDSLVTLDDNQLRSIDGGVAPAVIFFGGVAIGLLIEYIGDQ